MCLDKNSIDSLPSTVKKNISGCSNTGVNGTKKKIQSHPAITDKIYIFFSVWSTSARDLEKIQLTLDLHVPSFDVARDMREFPQSSVANLELSYLAMPSFVCYVYIGNWMSDICLNYCWLELLRILVTICTHFKDVLIMAIYLHIVPWCNTVIDMFKNNVGLLRFYHKKITLYIFLSFLHLCNINSLDGLVNLFKFEENKLHFSIFLLFLH